MKKSFLNRIFIFLLAPAILFSFASKPERADFSGEWKLNESKSDLGQMASFATTAIKADQKGDNISIARTAPSFDGGENTSTETLTFDGKEAESKVFGNSTRKSTGKWSDDGQTFTITFKLALDMNGETTEINGTEVWTLADAGKTLVVQNTSSSSFGDFTAKAVYEKQ